MPIKLNLLERTLMFTLNQAPAPTLDMYGVIANRAVSIALRFGIFEALKDNPSTAAEAAHLVKANEHGIYLLLEALESIGYITKQDGYYANTPMTTKWMLHDSPTSIVNLFCFFDSVIERCGHLEKTICNGHPPILAWEWFDKHPGVREEYYAAMLDGAKLASDEVVSKVTLPPSARKLLDAGGGHGLYSVKFCKRYPGLQAVVLDWAPALNLAREVIASEGAEEQVSVREGDFWKDDLGGGYDVVLLFNVIHMYTPDKNAQLVGKLKDSLNENGLLVIMDQVTVRGRGPASRAIARLQGLQLFNSVQGQTYPTDEIRSWLQEVGFKDIGFTRLMKAPSSGIVLGTKR